MSEERPPSEEPIETEPSQAKPATRAVPALDNEGVVGDRLAPSQVMRTVAVALLTAAVVLGGLLLLWQIRSVIGWVALALFLAAVLNPAVKWLERRHRMVKRSIAIVLTYLLIVFALLLIARFFLPELINEIRNLINFIVCERQSPGGTTAYLEAT